MIFLPEGISEFANVVETTFTNPAAGTIVAKSQGNRVVLMLSGSIGFALSTKTTGVAAGGGLQWSTQTQPIILNWHDHAVLVTSQWALVAGIAGAITVFEVLYRPTDR
jgi:hypothetical protein